jgi:hypothetical protein
MALIKCKECSHEISNKAESCPNCGAKRKKPVSKGCLIFVVLTVLFIVFIGSIDSGSSSLSYENSEKNPISAGIRKSITTISIENRDSFTWSSAKLFINGIMGGYKYEYDQPIAPGEKIEIGLMNFTKRNGDRFQPYKTDVKEVIVAVPGYDSPIYTF